MTPTGIFVSNASSPQIRPAGQSDPGAARWPALSNLRAIRRAVLRSKAGPNSYVEAVRGVGLGSIALTFALAALPTFGASADGTADGLTSRFVLIADMGAEIGRGGVATLTALLTVMIPLALVRLARPAAQSPIAETDEVGDADRILHLVVLFLGAASLSVLTLTVIGLGASRPTTAATVASVGLTAIPAAGIAVWLSSTILGLPSERASRVKHVIAESSALAKHLASFAPRRHQTVVKRRVAVPVWLAIVAALLIAWSILKSEDGPEIARSMWASTILVAWTTVPPIALTMLVAVTRRRSGDWVSLVVAFILFGFLDTVYIAAVVDLAAQGRIMSAAFLTIVLLVPILAVSLPQRPFGPIALGSALIGGLERTELYRVRLLNAL